MIPSQQDRTAQARQVAKEWRAVLMSDPCVYCGGTPDGLDHIKPVTRGGSDGYGNRAPACATCDQLKANTPLLVFLWACHRAHHRIARRRRLRTVQQRVGAFRASVRNYTRGLNG